MAIDKQDSVPRLIERLDAATRARSTPSDSDVGRICVAVKNALCDEVVQRGLQLPGVFLEPSPTSYARRLLHRDPDGRYSIVIMVWDANQGTPIHDHAGAWCVECVYEGRIEVTSYDIVGNADNALVRFSMQNTTKATVGEAGALIPPHDYHVIENKTPTRAVTIHVYGGEMNGCHAFRPTDEDGVYEKHWCELCYTDCP